MEIHDQQRQEKQNRGGADSIHLIRLGRRREAGGACCLDVGDSGEFLDDMDVIIQDD